ncbi:hypothetical protein MACK_002266 [Theileria orientalis]|uniref:Uncharacterized protein n=1 Tax=Theileria orientalis TaxID=68886 RepID=A0A976QV75_THEOR|nr:hypothetical protein MACK_002266 [Theileria orientalis]
MDPLEFDRVDKGSQSESSTVYDLPVYKGYGSDTPRRSNELDKEIVEETEETVLEIVEEPIETEEDLIDETVEDSIESTDEIAYELVEESDEEFVDESEDEEVDNVEDDSEPVEVKVMEVENEPMRRESTETEERTIPIVETPAPEKKSTNPKLKWEPKPSVPKYAITINSKLKGDEMLNTKITTKGKAAALAQAQMDKNKSRAKDGKEQLRRELEEKREANALARAKIVEAERARVAAAKLKREEQSEKLKREAAERFQKEKELKLKERAEYEEKKQEINRARVEAIKSRVFYICILYKRCVSISWFSSTDSTRPYDIREQIRPKIDNPEVFDNMLRFLERKGDFKDKNEAYEHSSKETMETISKYLGNDIAKIIIHIANMASLQSARSKEYEDYNLEVNSNTILEHIASVLESQSKEFDYGKIKESIYKWASFYLADDENCKQMKNDKSLNRVGTP